MNLKHVYSYLESFNITEKGVDVYLCLLKRGQSPAGEIAKTIKLSRASVYRELDKLIDMGLVNVVQEESSKEFIPVDPQQIDVLIQQKKRELEMKEGMLPDMLKELTNIQSSQKANSNIITYHGFQGLKTVTWNSTKARDELRIFEVEQDMSAFLDFDFSERIRIEFVKQGLKNLYQLTNSSRIDAWTNVAEFVDVCEFRYLDPAIFSLQLEVVVYNDVVAMYHYKKKDIFCIEIYNSEVAFMYKNIFDHFWKQAKQMKKIDSRGAARLVE